MKWKENTGWITITLTIPKTQFQMGINVFVQKEVPRFLTSRVGILLSENHQFSEVIKCFLCNTV